MENLILTILLIAPGVWSGDWRVTLKSQCALKGTSVVIECEYDYPIGHIVTSVSWSKGKYVSGQWGLFPLSTLSSPPHHFRYVGNRRGDCRMEVNDVQHADEGAYFFSFVTTFNRWTSRTYANLSVKELITVVSPSTVTEGDVVRLTCLSGCSTPIEVVWFRDGQPVLNPVFQASREDAGRYYCAVLDQKAVRSASEALTVHYAPKKVKLSVSPSGDVVTGGSVTFTCSSDASPSVTQRGYSLYKDGHFISSGQNHIISDIQPSHSGLYYCQAWNNISLRGIDLIKSSEVHLNVQYDPMNISVSMNPLDVVGGSSVNFTCSSAANPAADIYRWYKRTVSPISTVQVGSGQVLSIPSVDASHAGLYLCQARNRMGANNSTEVLLAMKEEQHGSQSLPILAGIGAGLFVALVIALLLFWKKHKTHAEKKQTLFDFRLSGRSSSSATTEDQINGVYVNINTFSPSSTPATDFASHYQTSSKHRHDIPLSYDDEVTYSTVTIKPRHPCPPHHINNSRVLQDYKSKAGENDSSVIYATVATSS